jgi:hypothetical protein
VENSRSSAQWGLAGQVGRFTTYTLHLPTDWPCSGPLKFLAMGSRSTLGRASNPYHSPELWSMTINLDQVEDIIASLALFRCEPEQQGIACA